MLDATVLIPTHNHGPLLELSVRSALAQTVDRIEVLIVGDGATPETRTVAHRMTEIDPRVRYFDYPKSPRTGEAYRHELLLKARSRIVCYLSDDDLWLPNHLAVMSRLLERADFAHTQMVAIEPGGTVHPTAADLSRPYYRAKLLGGNNRVPLTCAGHTLVAYRRLPHGWRSTPVGTPTDLYMWQQFLQNPDLLAVSSPEPTAVVFPSPDRREWTLAERLAEMSAWAARLPDLPTDPALLKAIITALYQFATNLERGWDWSEGQVRAEADRLRAECSRLSGELADARAEARLAATRAEDFAGALASAQRSRVWRAVNWLRARLGRTAATPRCA
jgi:glycosyltransferase involved in cell wall biosynthesis